MHSLAVNSDFQSWLLNSSTGFFVCSHHFPTSFFLSSCRSGGPLTGDAHSFNHGGHWFTIPAWNMASSVSQAAVSVISLSSDMTQTTSLVTTAVSQVLCPSLCAQPAASRRPVPSFIHTFSMPALFASFPTTFTSASSTPPVISSVVQPCYQQLFIVEPGFRPYHLSWCPELLLGSTLI